MKVLESIELVEGVDDDAPDPRLDRETEFLLALVVAMKHAGRGGHPSRESDVQLAAGRHVEQQALLVGEAGHGPAEERLGGVDDASRAESGDGLAATTAQMILVVDEERRSELLHERPEMATADGEPTIVGESRRFG